MLDRTEASHKDAAKVGPYADLPWNTGCTRFNGRRCPAGIGDSAVAMFDGFLSSLGGELLERKARLAEDLVAIHARQARKRRFHFFDGFFGDLADGSGDRRVGQLEQVVMAWPGGPLKRDPPLERVVDADHDPFAARWQPLLRSGVRG